MSKFVKIKAIDIDGGTTNGSDILIGDVNYVAQGGADGTGSANTFSVMSGAGASYTFTVTAQGLAWANQFISACTANPGGVMSIVQNSTGVKISGISITYLVQPTS
jgi:hypothetical protein|tara:strand:+ start:56 stop:373 length:318 start_codon:yes stop_codon:yes gene_type:complete